MDGKSAHKRRIALLAVLAVARGRTVGRERLIGLLWADHRTAAARHLLSESLYVLRKRLGADAFVSTGDEVGLNGAVVRSDVEEFESRVEEGAVEEAARLYRGPFLDGFFVPGSVEFEQWAEAERARLARVHSRALECLADAREADGRAADAAEWWRRLGVLDPSNTRVGMRLMMALDAAGERGAALWFAQSHIAYLDDELGVEPEDEFLDLMERLKTEPVRVPRPPLAPSAPILPADARDATPPEPASTPDAPARATPAPDSAAEAPQTAPGPNPPASAAEEAPQTASAPDRPASAAEAPATARAPDLPAAAEAPHTAPAPNPAPEAPHTAPAPDSPARTADPRADTDTAHDEAPHPRTAAENGARENAPGSVEIPEARDVAEAEVVPARTMRTAGRAQRRWARVGIAALSAGLLVFGLQAFGGRGDEPAPPVASGYDPRRVAVLYFEDDSRGGELGYLAGGLTESLIHELGRVPALEVISRNGVKPYRHGTVPLARMVADLQAGTVVEGSVQRSGDSVRVTVDLVDARTGVHVESRKLTYPLTDVFAMEDALADSVSGFLRRRVGEEVHLRRVGRETKSLVAWRALLQAEQASDDAAALQRSDDALGRDGVLRLLASADSLLTEAERADPQWPRPVVQRGWIAFRRAPLVGEGAARQNAALAFAERALVLRPGYAPALELRGAVHFARAVAAVDSAGQTAQVDAAERDLRASVAGDSSLAAAWNRLSLVLRYRGRAAESDALARRALNEDAWLEGADAILVRLYFGALYAADYAQARSLCGQGHARYPGDWRFVECRLTLLRADPSRLAQPAEVAALLAELDRLDPAGRALRQGRAYSPAFRLAVAAGALARAGHPDRARALLARARSAAAGDAGSRVSLAYDEAAVYLLLGRPDSARALLEWSFTVRPAQRAFAARDPLFRALPSAGAPPSAGTRAPPLPRSRS